LIDFALSVTKIDELPDDDDILVFIPCKAGMKVE